MKVKRILAPVDFSDVSNQSLEAAVSLAEQLHAKIVVLHAVEPVYFAGTMFGPEINVPNLVEEQRSAAASAMKDIVARLERKGIGSTGLVETGSPYNVILRTAEERKCDLVVMGTHGRSGVSHLLLGSVAEKVVRAATCPVLTVRGRDRSKAGSVKSKRPSKR